MKAYGKVEKDKKEHNLMITPTQALWDSGKALYPEWGEGAFYLHWCDMIVLNNGNHDGGAFFVTKFEEKFSLIIVKDNYIYQIFDVEDATHEKVFYKIAQNLKASYEIQKKNWGNFPALTRAYEIYEKITKIRFNNKEKIKDVFLTEHIPFLMLTSLQDILMEPTVRHENLSVKSSSTSAKNYRRKILKALNPIIKSSELKFSNVVESERNNDLKDSAALNTQKTEDGFFLNFLVFKNVLGTNLGDKTVTIHSASVLFNFLSPSDKTDYSYKEFVTFFAQVVEDVKSWLNQIGIDNPTEEQINRAILLAGSKIGSHSTQGKNRSIGDGIAVMASKRRYLTLAEVEIFVKEKFPIPQILKVYELNIPVESFTAYKEAPTEWLESVGLINESSFVNNVMEQHF